MRRTVIAQMVVSVIMSLVIVFVHPGSKVSAVRSVAVEIGERRNDVIITDLLLML